MPEINEQTFRTVFHDYLAFLEGVDNAAEAYVERARITQPNRERRTPLRLRLISEKKDEAKRIGQCVQKLIVGHEVLTDFTENIREAVDEMEQYTHGDIRRQDTLFAIMTDGEDLPSLPEKISARGTVFNAICFVRVRQNVLRNGAWTLPTEWLRALVKLRGAVKFGFYFMLESLNYPVYQDDADKADREDKKEKKEKAYAKAVAAALVTVSETFNPKRANLPSVPNSFSGVDGGENKIALAWVYSLNVARIGILLTCARKLKKKLNCGETDGNGIRQARKLQEVFQADAFRAVIDSVNQEILKAVDKETAFSQMASMPLDGGCEERLADALASRNRTGFNWFGLGKKRKEEDIPLADILGITPRDTRFDDYYQNKILGAWRSAIDSWFSDPHNLYWLFRRIINCFTDLTSAQTRFKEAIESVLNARIRAAEEKAEGFSGVLYSGETTVREAAQNYIRAVFGEKLKQDMANTYITILKKIFSSDIRNQFDETIKRLVDETTKVANRIWPSLNDEINGFRDNHQVGGDNLSQIGELYRDSDESAFQHLLDVPDVRRFIPDTEKIAQLRDTLAREADNNSMRLVAPGELPQPVGEWIIQDSDNHQPIESYQNGKICFVIRRSNKHPYYLSFDEQDVIRVNINLYSLQGFFDQLENNGGTEQ